MVRIWYKIILALRENFYGEQDRLIVTVPFLFALGIALYFSLPREPGIWLIVGIFEVWLLLFYLCRYKNMHLLFVAGLIVLCGFMDIQAQTYYKAKQVKFMPQTLTYLSGKIIDVSYSEKAKKRFLLTEVSDFEKPRLGKYRITSTNPHEDFEINQCVEMAATIFPPSPMPIMHGYQLDRKYFYEGISGMGFSSSEIFAVDCANDGMKEGFIAKINSLRREIEEEVFAVLSNETAGIAAALLVGEKTLVPAQIVRNYRNSGLAHFLSVSGLHLGAITALIFFIVRWFISFVPYLALRYDSKKIAAIGAIGFSIIYLFISGHAIPAQRALIMTTVVLIGVILNRQAISMRMVSFAALAILVISPQALISISFQMSFAAVYALVAFYERYAASLAELLWHRGILRGILLYLFGIILCDFIASLATAPFSLYHFHMLAIYTSLGNLLAGPLIALWLMPAVLLCLVSLVFNLSFYPLQILGAGIAILNKITSFVAALPDSVWHNNTMPFWGFMLIVCGGYWLCIWQRPWRKWGIWLVICGLFSMTTVEIPDVIIAPKGMGAAVRDDENNMVLVPYHVDSWIKSVWQENFNLISYKNYADENNIQLECFDEKCVYRDMITFTSGGEIYIGKNKIDNFYGGYIYIDEEPVFRSFVSKNICRPWQMCSQEKE